MAPLARVWTEREGDIVGTPDNEGDWEACVSTSYSMALLYGGVKMAAPYTKAQRELLEAIPDAPQDLAATDAKSLQVYGVKLRGATPGLTVAQALGRPGIGLCLTTNDSPGGFGTGFIHEVFWIGVSATAGLLYDPLAPEGSAPQSRTVAYMLPWIRGVAAHQIREVKENEFAPIATGEPMIEKLTSVPDGSSVQFEANKPYQFWNYAPARATWVTTFLKSTGAPTTGIVKLTGEVEAYFIPKVWDGAKFRLNAYLAVTAAQMYSPPATPTDCSAAVADATAPLEQRITELEGAIQSHVDEVTKPEEDLLAALD